MKKIVMCTLVLLLTGMFLGGCATKETAEADLAQIVGDIEAQQLLPEGMEDLNAADLEKLYNIKSSEYSQFAGKINNVGILGDEVVLVEAADKAAVETIKGKMEQRYQSKLNQMDGYIPEEYEKIKNGNVLVEGNYVALLVAENQDKVNEIFKAGVFGER
ncbi:DUF4358 domain-containing protein [Desulfitobacterium hafniense]|uniref:DUF4358 domain-containing protein n=1 Tax=Desulfitobacterium hafniense TaxID=49338 RepID=UPI00036D3744|nr:DUF4358 domain-containing protein [Desulfitobacterium hafniense]